MEIVRGHVGDAVHIKPLSNNYMVKEQINEEKTNINNNNNNSVQQPTAK